FAPYAELKIGATHIQREVETPQLPGEIGPQLARRLVGYGVNPVSAALDRARKVEIYGAQPGITCNQPHSQTIYNRSLGTVEHALSLSHEIGSWSPRVRDMKVRRFAQMPANRKNPGVHHTARQSRDREAALPDSVA